MTNILFETLQELSRASKFFLSLDHILDELKPIVNNIPWTQFYERWKTIHDNYELMVRYAVQGIEDPKREEVYRHLLRNTYILLNDMLAFGQNNNSRSHALAVTRAAGIDATPQAVKARLEDYVSSLAMLELEQGEQKKKKAQAIHADHQKFMDSLFCHIITTPTWQEADADCYAEMLLSPTIESRDASLIVSALTVASGNVFDINKVSLLYRIATKSTDEHVRQRALVGFLLTADQRYKDMFPELQDMARDIVGEQSPYTLDDLVDTQKQIVYCLTVREDNETIQEDIIPELTSQNIIQITKNGDIKECEEGQDDDILNNEGEEDRMAKIEESMQKMRQMEQAGSDIYFGGFSQMKRFPFFYTLSNWLCPFYLDHPDLQPVTDSFGENGIPQMLRTSGPFCDSDRYSFLIALSSVYKRLPDGMKEMISGSNFGSIGSMDDSFDTPGYIRRMYLQDLYRFYKLYPDNGDFVNPFIPKLSLFKAVFFSNDLFGPLLDERRTLEFCDLLVRRKCYTRIIELMPHVALTGWRREYYLGVALFREENPEASIVKLEWALEHFDGTQQEEKKLLNLMLRNATALDDRRQALSIYEMVLKRQPDNTKAKVHYLVTLIYVGRIDEALKLAYEVSFTDEKSLNVRRAYAWALLNAGKLNEALREYEQILKHSESDANDLLNKAYCHWGLHQTALALDSLMRFYILWNDTDRDSEEGATLYTKIAKDKDLLKRLSISDIESKMMAELAVAKADNYTQQC